MQEIQNIAADSMLINFDEFRRVDGTINLFELAKHVFERSPAYSSQPFPELLARAFFHNIEQIQPIVSRQAAAVAIGSFFSDLSMALGFRKVLGG